MSFFNFGSKPILPKEYSLGEIPVFSSLSLTEQKTIYRCARLEEYKRGDTVYEEDTSADFFYVVISGRFRLFKRARPNHPEETLAYFYRSDHFGETSLLTVRPHSATIEAKRDGLLLKLPKEDFLKIVNEMPSVSLHLNRSLGHRLTHHLDASGKREVKIAVLYTQTPSPDAVEFWLDFATRIAGETKGKVALIDFSSQQEGVILSQFSSAVPVFSLSQDDPSSESKLSQHLRAHPKNFDYMRVHVQESGAETTAKKLNTLLTFLTYRYNFLLLRLPPEISDPSFKVLKKSDLIYIYAPRISSSLDAYQSALLQFEQNFGFSKSELKVIAAATVDDPEFPLNTKENSLGVPIFWLLPAKDTKRDQYEAGVRFLAKELVGTLLGLALGSGAAYGLAHIGVIKVLEENGIYPDIISGTSIGALVGAFWGAGYTAKQLEDLAIGLTKKRAFFDLIGFGDFALFPKGFLKGHRVKHYLEARLGKKVFQDMKIPLKIIATDLMTSEAVCLDTGLVSDAVRASISIPGIFEPVYAHGRHLIDGGVIDPLPVRILSHAGVKKIVAVNVLAGPKQRVERFQIGLEAEKLKPPHRPGFFSRMMGASDKIPDEHAVNIFNIIMSTIQFMEFEIANACGQEADVLIHPIVLRGHWAEFYDAEKFIRVGEEKTREQLDEIKKLIRE